MSDITDNIVTGLGFKQGQNVCEMGYGEDVDRDFREKIALVTGRTPINASTLGDGAADVVLLWFREGDGNLTDALVDATEQLYEDQVIVLATPKTGRTGYVESSDISEAAEAAGVSQQRAISIGSDWAATQLRTPKVSKPKR